MVKDFDSNENTGNASGSDTHPRAFDIAIIGLAGRYPQAENLEELWENLKLGRDCITTVPSQRWDHDAIYDPAKGVSGKTYSKWGGFLRGVDEFDPRFFNISPREAEIMDPQERLFLQCAYHLLEDAGYTRQSLSAKGRVGVYVGVQYTEYTAFSTAQTLVAALPASIANRVSFFCDFRGPSLTLDSMCSSSLTTIHLACQSLRSGESEYAIAGGVNVSIHPNKYLLHAQGRFASSVGCCKTFGQGGDGYVPAEGVGAVLLKPLSQAIVDGDRIHAVIKGSSINHGGRATGFTVPKSSAQAVAVRSALHQAGLAPNDLSYLEAHGTGTALGDLIEIEGLRTVFEAAGFEPQACAIGSIKSNIGHCESAAGIAGLTKVLLQLKHGQLVPSLHSTQLNRNIDFAGSPFHVQQALAPWQPKGDGDAVQPRRAGVSSFGAGGSNAHLVVEEYRPQTPAHHQTQTLPDEVIIVLSARTPERLQAVAARLLGRLEDAQAAPASDLAGLHDLAYTLQVGREALDVRAAFTIHSVQMLKERLRALADGDRHPDVFSGQALKPVRPRAGETAVHVPPPSMDDSVAVMRHWVSGGPVDWSQLYQGFQPSRISLPLYPFIRERCWVPPTPEAAAQVRFCAPGDGPHPLLARQVKAGDGQQFEAQLRGDEFFLDHHRVNGRKVLPGVVYLEMALAALTRVSGQADLALNSVLWVRPFECFDDPVSITLSVEQARKGDGWEFEFFAWRSREPGTEPVREVYCRGQASLAAAPAPVARLDVTVLAALAQGAASTDEFYRHFAAVGIDYGPGHRGLHALRGGAEQVLGHLRLPDFLKPGDEFRLHPCLLDSALQAAMGFTAGRESSQGPHVPFSLEQLTLGHSRRTPAWVRLNAHKAGGGRGSFAFDLDVFDDQGEPCVHLRGMRSRVMTRSPSAPRLALLTPGFKALVEPASVGVLQGHWIYLCPGSEIHAAPVAEQFPLARCVLLERSDDQALALPERYRRAAQALSEHLRQLPQNGPGCLLQLVVADDDSAGLFAGLFGLLRSFAREQPSLRVQLINLKPGDTLPPLLQGICNADAELALHRRDGQLACACWQRRPDEQLAANPVDAPWKPTGVYLLTGASGALARSVAQDIASAAPGVTLVLVGRGAPDDAMVAHIERLKGLGAQVLHRTVDLADEAALRALVEDVSACAGALTGVLHIAGCRQDGLLRNKPAEHLEQVLLPKVDGLWNLDCATHDQPLEFFLAFASIAGALGNAGQSDYACANAFMDQFAHYRNRHVVAGTRQGRTIVIDWPLWEHGGMHLSPDQIEAMARATGLRPLATSWGLRVLRHVIHHGGARWLVLPGQGAAFEALIDELGPGVAAPVAPRVQVDPSDTLRGLVGQILKVDAHEVDDSTAFADMGFDSVMLTELAAAIHSTFALELGTGPLFEHPTLQALAAHLQGALTADPVSPAPGLTRVQVAQGVREVVAQALKVRLEDIGDDDPWSDYGMDSVSSVQMTDMLNERFDIQLAADTFQTFGNVVELTAAIADVQVVQSCAENERQPTAGVAAAGAEPALVDELVVLVCQLLKTVAADIDPQADLHDFGFDSVLLTQLLAQISSTYGVELDPGQVLEDATLAGLAAQVQTQRIGAHPATSLVSQAPPRPMPQDLAILREPARRAERQGPVVVLLSAGSAEQLRQVADNLLHLLDSEVDGGLDLHTLASVTQAGSGLMPVRLGLSVASLGELAERLRAYLKADEHGAQVQAGDAQTNARVLNRVMALPGLADQVQGWLHQGGTAPLLQLWSQGLEIDWRSLASAQSPALQPSPVSISPSRLREPVPVVTLLDHARGHGIYCFPAAGAGAQSFHALAAALDDVAQLHVLEYPPLDAQAQPDLSLHRMVAAHVHTVTRRSPAGVVRLLGHSFGASVAFEVALELQARGRQVQLYMLDSFFYVPQDLQGQVLSRAQLSYFLGDTPLCARLLEAQDNGAVVSLQQVRQLMRDASLTQTHAEGPGVWLAAQIAMSVDYQPTRAFTGDTCVIIAAQSILGAGSLPHTLARYCAYLTTTPHVATVDGGHMSMLNPANVHSLARAVRQHLDTPGGVFHGRRAGEF
ncbi:SDR family NAD(P)-dependent oxidoreductase [Pseudomonas fluorescens]|uniref:SDR family NAD(P)-dependent oxidoreductase n=1 Tax=Pseudomonas fluorescens TaxID=294 RepID=A0AAE2PU63_PSEFL|nr:SDR family NAD(P)-dependent oxidoreductase [Pseudomonas fluorescens]MBD8268129.1 SDR family NAD(P)-dependent oxidoreductase [Pseudomonas fluorescens]